MTGKPDGPPLIVEDSPLIAMASEDTLALAGHGSCLVAGTVASALALIDEAEPGFALLVTELDGSDTAAIARRLRERGIPFAFAAAFADGSDLPPGFADAAFLHKPYAASELVALFARLTTE